MKIFLNNTDLTVPPYALTAKLDGYSIQALAGSLLWNDGYNGSYVVEIKNTIKELGKPVNIALLFGKFSHNAIYNNFPYLEFIRKHHNGAGNPVPMKIPVPFYSEIKDGIVTYPYLNKVRETIEYLSDELKKDVECYDLIEAITITGINEATKETRFTSQDWSTATTAAHAYEDASNKWLAEGYTDAKATQACITTIEIFNSYFPDKRIIFPSIPGKNSFPAINGDKACLPNQRKDLKKGIITFGQNLSKNFYSQYTSFTATTNTDSLYVQSNKVFHQTATLEQYEAMITHAKQTGKINLEVHPSEILKFPSVFKQ